MKNFEEKIIKEFREKNNKKIKRYCVNCEKETFAASCPYCGCKKFKDHKCDGGDDEGMIDCYGCEKEMLKYFRSFK